MLIDKAEIERVKRANDLVALVRGRGVKLTRRGKQLVGLCPFHLESEPSFFVDPKKQLWNCLGACNEGGDVYRFVMKADGVDFREAHRRLGGRMNEERGGMNEEQGSEGINAEGRGSGGGIRPGDEEWLARYAEQCHKLLLKTLTAQDYARSRGISNHAMTVFKLGYSDGRVAEKFPVEGRAALSRLGVLTESGRELMAGCVLFPLVAAATGQVISLYGRHIKRRQHLYLPGERRGIFNPQGARNTEEVVITESVIDGAALWSAGIKNAIPIYGTTGLTSQIAEHLVECRVKRAVLMLDTDEPGRAAIEPITARLADVHVVARAVEIPAKDVAEFIAQGGTGDQLRALIAGRASDSVERESAPSALKLEGTAEDGAILLSADGRKYRVRNLTARGLDRLKVNLRINVGSGFYLDTVDLYQGSARKRFGEEAAKLVKVADSVITRDLMDMADLLEPIRLAMRNGEEKQKDQAAMTAEEHRAAMAYLKSPKIVERAVEDLHACGLIGEQPALSVGYLATISRKLANKRTKPLSVLVIARSGAGKSSLQDGLCSLVPAEDLVRVTRLTGQALFYKDPYSLERKVLAIAEVEGASQAGYSLRTLISDQHLSTAATRTDPQTGKLHTEHYELYGPVSVVTTTTSPEAFDEETRNRFVQLTMNESREQTLAILAQQRRAYTLEGVLEEAAEEGITRLHQNVQRLLRPLKVVNPHVERLGYPADRLISRREHEKYQTLICAIALLYQHQREIKQAGEVEYVEVELEDIALANELAREVLWLSFDELAPPVRAMLGELKQLFERRAAEMGKDIYEVAVTRREIREVTGWSEWQVRSYCQKLVEMEYLTLVPGNNGKPAVYKLVWPIDEQQPGLGGLTDVEQLRKEAKA
jgi:DNA primase catalytic core